MISETSSFGTHLLYLAVGESGSSGGATTDTDPLPGGRLTRRLPAALANFFFTLHSGPSACSKPSIVATECHHHPPAAACDQKLSAISLTRSYLRPNSDSGQNSQSESARISQWDLRMRRNFTAAPAPIRPPRRRWPRA